MTFAKLGQVRLRRRLMPLAVAAALTLSAPVLAQTNTTGSIFGQAHAGGKIIIENINTGAKREIEVGSNGTYRVTRLNNGVYRVTEVRQDGTTAVRDNVTVNIGTGTAVNFVFEGEAQELDIVSVYGIAVNPIDVSSVESTTILTEQQIDRLPVSRTTTDVALLAPGTVRGDSRFGNLASFGGASVAENVYYINGFNVTNIVTGTAFNQLPFEAVSEFQVKTGGYGAEFGRSLGGVMNVISKRGGNEWHFGGNAIWSPNGPRGERVRWIKDPTTGEWTSVFVNSYDEQLTYNVYASGPIVKDRLFVYALVQGRDDQAHRFGQTTQYIRKVDTPQYFVKVDWNINDDHTLELTGFRDKVEEKYRYWNSPVPYGRERGSERLPDMYTSGGDNWIAKWTGNFTDNFSLSAMYGVGKYDRSSDIGSAGCPAVQDQRSSPVRSYGCWSTSAIDDPNANDKRTAYRVDAEWFLGESHTLRFGLDHETYETTGGLSYSGPDRTIYLIRTLNPGSTLNNGYTNTTGAPIDYVYNRTFFNGGTFEIENSAWYIEDSWQITDNFMAYLGLRNEGFKNMNADGDPFIDISDTWAPRLGFSWDVRGDSSFKIFGNAGRYYIPVYGNTNLRLAGAETDYFEYYVWDGTFSNDIYEIPGRGAMLGPRLTISNGETPDPRTVVDPEIDPMYQDEFIAGAQYQLTPDWAVGIRGIYRELKSGIDDTCSGEYAYNWALANGYSEDQAAAIGDTVDHCFLYNVGADLHAYVDLEGTGSLTLVTIPAEGLGLPKAKRSYRAVELYFERTWNDVWYLQGSYTWAKSYGNTEGYVKSDIGQDDAGLTQDFDYPGLMEGAYGPLPNDRRHTLKLFGAYQVADEWRLGFNYLIQSGRPKNCIGYYAGDADSVAIQYGAASFYCNNELTPRGSQGRLPWQHQLDLQLTYEPNWLDGLRFSLDVFNVFNDKTVRVVRETGESARGTPSPTYLEPLDWQPPRQLRFTVEYHF